MILSAVFVYLICINLFCPFLFGFLYFSQLLFAFNIQDMLNIFINQEET